MSPVISFTVGRFHFVGVIGSGHVTIIDLLEPWSATVPVSQLEQAIERQQHDAT